MANVSSGWMWSVVISLILTSVYYAFLSMLPLSVAATWGNPFTTELSDASFEFPGLSSWARLVSTLIVWMPIMFYETVHTQMRAMEGGTVFGGVNARSFVYGVRFFALLMFVIHTVVNWWILITGYVWGFFQCFSAPPNPIWCTPHTIQSWGASISFALLVMLNTAILFVWIGQMFIVNNKARRPTTTERVSLVNTSKTSTAMRFTDHKQT